MIFMTENKAQELFQRYLQAELQGRNDEAASLEQELNSGNWYISSGPEGMTLTKKGKEINAPDLSDYYMPKESSVAPNPANDNPNRALWITLSIAGALILISIAVYIIIKRKRDAAKLAGLSTGG